MFEILDCGCLRTSFKPYLAFLALGRLTYKMLASVTGSGDTLGGGGLLSSEATCNSHNNCLDQVYLIPGKTRTRGPCLVPMAVFLVRVPSLPGLFQCHVNLGRRWSRRPTWPGDRGAGLPSALAPGGPGQALHCRAAGGGGQG